MNKDSNQSLTDELKAFSKYCAKSANQEMFDEYTARNNKALTERIDKHKVDLRKLPDSVLRELKKITEEVMKDFIADDPMAQKVYKSYSEFKEQVINYHRISEKAYIDTRELD